ncbi:MAG TPA: dihydrofolate reductase family protein [Vicinamibacterales bacterium]|nr:dihydrofolate reductase family protein [Vicinamibacterales bacterium]
MARFEDFAVAKTREVARARIEQLSTVFETDKASRSRAIGNAWTRKHYGGDFTLVEPPANQTALSLVFVQSKNRNTGGGDPALLGGGATDKHLIYEGLTRVAADAVLAGAGTLYADAFFSVWHPELVSLRRDLGLPRHPAQIVVSKRGRLDFNVLLFNVPDVTVFLIAGDESMPRNMTELAMRPWIRQIPLTTEDLRPVLDRLRIQHGIGRISAVGGRFTASRLVDAGLAQDLYLTTTSREGGEPGTPWYSGDTRPSMDVITKKQWTDDGSVLVFEHFMIADRR